jgi:DNA-binding NarL/FixJ family response regulator
VIVTLSCLIIDDSEKFLSSATRLLSLQGVSVVGRVSTGDEALRLATELRPDVTLVDVELGDEDGIEVARRLTSGGLPAMVILISLRDRNELTELIAGSGAIGFLRKDALDAQAIADLIAQRRQRNIVPEPPHVS